ncbi:MAG TPA: biopolymer transporter ExbD [Halothiobacillus sp.]|jgi:biopolymer transport protein ExbD|nr:biopolymer transporter ExbD [Halothiobacillus sp.]
MFIWQNEPRRKARIEIIPMIDVMMFLLVFFVLISMNVIPATGIKTQLPGSAQPDHLNRAYHAVIIIGAQGRLQLEGKDYDLTTLGAALDELHQSHKDIDLVIDGDKGSALQDLVSVMDVVKSSGITAVSIATKKK